MTRAWLGAAIALAAVAGCKKKSETPGEPPGPAAPAAPATEPRTGPEPAATPGTPEEKAMTLAIRPDVADRLARYARVPLAADAGSLSDSDRLVLAELRKAADIMGELAFRQVWTGNVDLREKIATGGPAGTGENAAAARDLFRIMGGPWDRQDEWKPFIGDVAHPPGSAFYPEDLTKEEFESWVSAHADLEDAFRGFFTVVRRDGGNLAAVPYSEAYRGLLGPAAEALRSAAAITENASLRRYLLARAAAFESNDYYESDLAWLDLDGSLEVVIGPYETYDDGLLGYKASFEAFLCVDIPEESARLAKYKGEVAWLESILPIPAEHRNPERGAVIPIRVVDELYATGQAGVMTIAFNLPNDERVRKEKGFKNVLLRNVMQAKYDAILVPIAERVLPAEMAMRMSFEPFMNFVLFHEISHGLGPGHIVRDGVETEVRKELRELYPTIEEAKADILSLFVQKALADKGVLEPSALASLPEAYVAGVFRTCRFGISEAHGRGMLLQVNYLMEKGAIEVTADGKFAPVAEKFFDAARDLAAELLMFQALGDYEGANAFLEKYGKEVPPAMPPLIESLGAGIPVDIDPVFPQ